MKNLARLSWLPVAALMLAVTAIPAFSQQFNQMVKGQITGADGKPVVGATVTFTRTDIKTGSYKCKSDKKGFYQYATLPLGTFDMVVTDPNGKEVYKQQGISTHPDQPATVDVNLSASAVAAPPPGMTKEQADAYEKKMKEQQEQTAKIGQLNGLLQQNKALQDQKQWDQAIAIMEQAVAIDQTKDVLYANLGADYMGAGQYDKAAAAYQKAITLKPTDASYHINLGSVYSKQSKMDDANAEFAKAKQLDPASAGMASYNTAVTLFNQGKTDEALAEFEIVLQQDPNNADAWYWKGMALLSKAGTDAKGNPVPVPGTVEALQKSLQIAPTGDHANDCKQTLQALGVTSHV